MRSIISFVISFTLFSWSVRAKDILRQWINKDSKSLAYPNALNKIVQLNVSSHSLCVYDPLTILWSFEVSVKAIESIMIGVLVEGQSQVALTSLDVSGKDTNEKGHTHSYSHLRTKYNLNAKHRSIIQCAIDEDHCKPEIHNIVADLDNRMLIVQFRQATNEPVLSQSTYITSALKVSIVITVV